MKHSFELAGLFGSEARVRVLAHFLAHNSEGMHLRALERHIGVGKRSLQQELERLERMGLVDRCITGELRQEFIATSLPAWQPILDLFQRFAPHLILRDLLAECRALKAAFIVGSFARGDSREDSDIDLILYGTVAGDAQIGRALSEASLLLDQKLDVKWYDERSFTQAIKPGASFLGTAISEPAIWLIGSPADVPAWGTIV